MKFRFLPLLLALLPLACLAQTKVSDLPAAATITGTEKIPAVQGAASVSLTAAQLAAFVDGVAGGISLSSGVSGNLGVSHLNSGTGAGASTYWNGTGVWSTPPTVVGSNPSAITGLAAINGSATTFMRSDAAPALNLNISPTWLGNHSFSPAAGIPITVQAPAGSVAAQLSGVSGTSTLKIFPNSGSAAIQATAPAATQATALAFGQTGQTQWQIYEPASNGSFRVNDSAGNDVLVLGPGAQSGNAFLASPNGTTGAFAARTIVGADVPAINLAGAGNGGVTGNLGVAHLNSGTGATATTFWSGAGTWSTPAGSVSSVGLSAPSVFSVAGSPVTSSGTLAVTFATGQTANSFLATPNGTTGAVGLRTIVAADLPSLSANPAASVGLAAVNGAATTYLRSDAAPALSQAIAPTWTGNHAFTPASGSGITLNGVSGSYGELIQGNVATGGSLGLTIHAGTNTSDAALLVNNAANVTQYFKLAGDGGALLGAPTGGDQGLGTLNATGLFINGTAVSASVGANPSASVGLSAVNGTATTWMRSDAAPALNQAIIPTWTGAHVFSGALRATGPTTPNVAVSGVDLDTNGNSPRVRWSTSTGAADTKFWEFIESNTGIMTLRTLNDANSAASNALVVTRTGAAVAGLTFGNATDNPFYFFGGTGAITGVGSGLTALNGTNISSGTVAAARVANISLATSGNGGVIGNLPTTNLNSGTSASSTTYWSGAGTWTTPAGTTAPANPAASVGLTAINGSAATFMRSDGAPALSQAISPNMTGNWTFTPSSGTGLTVSGQPSAQSAKFFSATGAGLSFGPEIIAGTNSSDLALQIRNAANTANYLVVFGDGGTALGSATDQGLGTLNATGLFVSGSTVPPVNASPTWTGNHTFAPASGIGISVNQVSGTLGMRVVAPASDGARIGLTDGNTGNQVFQLRDGSAATGTFDVFDATSIASRLQIPSTGGVQIPAPSSGVGLNVNGVSGQFAGAFNGANAAAGQALQINGLFTGAGATNLLALNDVNNTNGANIRISGNGVTTPTKTLRVAGGVFQILNSGYTGSILSITDAGTATIPALVIGAPTGGAIGAGDINAQGVFENGTAVNTSNATVSSVALALPSIFSVSGSPITTAGTLTGSLATQSANTHFAGPASGVAAAPTFRALVSADLPAVNLASSSAGGVTGNLPVTNLNGGTAASSTTYWSGAGTWTVPAGSSAANPTASVGLAAVNGTAATFMRSDGAPSLSQSISPTWTGQHTFSFSSGTPVVINSPPAGAGLQMNGPASSGTGLILVDGNTGNQAWQIRNGYDGTGVLGFQSSATSTTPLSITPSGNVVVAAPASGATLTITGAPVGAGASAVAISGGTNTNNVALAVTSRSSGAALTLVGQNVAGASHGLIVLAGTNASDANTGWASASGAFLGNILGDGSLVMGSPTGGGQGLGTINATGIFVNGVAVGGTSNPFLVNSATCAAAGGFVGTSAPGFSGCTQSAGVATFNFLITHTALANCTATAQAASAIAAVTSISTTAVQVTTTLSGTATSEKVALICQGS